MMVDLSGKILNTLGAARGSSWYAETDLKDYRNFEIQKIKFVKFFFKYRI